MTILRHMPVMLAEVLAALRPEDGQAFVDATFGAGGYTRAMLDAALCSVIAIERDPQSFAAGQSLRDIYQGRLTLVERQFSELDRATLDTGRDAVDGVVFDVGVSSMQLDDPERGFSFLRDGPLDMRMGGDGPSAADVVNTADDEHLANILFQLGDERRSRAIARAIIRAREIEPISTTLNLASVVERVLGRSHGNEKHPATRTFQALRIYVNDELGELAHGLAAAERVLRPGGRLAVVSFHSLEDRIVKRFLAERSGQVKGGSRHMPERSIKSDPPSFQIVNSRPLTPSKGELDVNPRARSARLRVAIRTTAAPHRLNLDSLEVARP